MPPKGCSFWERCLTVIFLSDLFASTMVLPTRYSPKVVMSCAVLSGAAVGAVDGDFGMLFDFCADGGGVVLHPAVRRSVSEMKMNDVRFMGWADVFQAKTRRLGKLRYSLRSQILRKRTGLLWSWRTIGPFSAKFLKAAAVVASPLMGM